MTLIVAGYSGVSSWGRKSYGQIFLEGDTLTSVAWRPLDASAPD
jgi:hypothetical protein